MPSQAAVAVRGLTKRFGSRVTALDDVSFEIPANSLFGLLGPNGAGKTTLFSIAANFLQATSGSVEVFGIDVRQISKLRGRFSMLPQDALFERNVPVLEQMKTFCRLNGQTHEEADQSAQRALETVGLSDAMNRAARTLSHGMTKRMALAQAFLGNPEVVLLDEPTAGLDPQNAANIRNLVREMSGTKTVVISSHNLAEIQEMCSHSCILDHGKVVAVGSMAELLGSEHTVRITFNKPVTPSLLKTLTETSFVKTVTQPQPDSIAVHLDLAEGTTKDEVISKILQAASTEGFVPRTINEGTQLEERFLQMTGGVSDALGST